jgi:hypothetical protein
MGCSIRVAPPSLLPSGVIHADSVLGNDDLSLPKGIAYYFLYIANIAGSA